MRIKPPNHDKAVSKLGKKKKKKKDMNVHWSVWEHFIPPVKTKDSKIHIERQNT